MKNLFIIAFSAILLFGCSSSKVAQMGTVSEEPCRNKSDVSDKNVFTGESVENLNVFQQGTSVYATMDVRTNCNSNVAFDMEQNKEQIKLKIRNSGSNADCVCIKKVTTSIANLGAGTYQVTIMNANNQLLQQTNVTVKD